MRLGSAPHGRACDGARMPAIPAELANLSTASEVAVSSTTIHTSPAAPRPFVSTTSASSSLRES